MTVELASNNGVGCIGVVALSGVSLEFHSSGRTYGGGSEPILYSDIHGAASDHA